MAQAKHETSSQLNNKKPILFYDGSCGLCHGVVRWAVRHDRAGVFSYAPLQGVTFDRLLGAQREQLPDTVMILDENDGLYLRSNAVIFMLQRLGWQQLASTLAVAPAMFRDALYSAVAKLRFAIFGRKQEICPLVPQHLRDRFLD